MTPEQKAAYVMAQAACAMAEIAGMQAENQSLAQNGDHVLYGKVNFDHVVDQYCIGHNAVLALFRS